MRAALEHLTARAGGRRRIAVLGDMRELGPEGPAYHEEIGALLGELGVEHVIAVGELARSYGGEWVATAEEAAERLRDALRPGDVVLVKGSLAVGLEVVAENITA
jgi:UDP-N-acetylmuramoyl-tripeptide--D-alanyl-D-alanine ligase